MSGEKGINPVDKTTTPRRRLGVLGGIGMLGIAIVGGGALASNADSTPERVPAVTNDCNPNQGDVCDPTVSTDRTGSTIVVSPTFPDKVSTTLPNVTTTTPNVTTTLPNVTTTIAQETTSTPVETTATTTTTIGGVTTTLAEVTTTTGAPVESTSTVVTTIAPTTVAPTLPQQPTQPGETE